MYSSLIQHQTSPTVSVRTVNDSLLQYVSFYNCYYFEVEMNTVVISAEHFEQREPDKFPTIFQKEIRSLKNKSGYMLQ